MKILVLVGQYPDPGGHLAQHFIHVRNVAYQKSGIDVTVLCFSATANYVYDGIKVITLNEFKCRCKSEHYDIAIFQQPNIRYHFKFVLRYGKLFDRFIWFFHGQEVLRTGKVYPKPYSYMKKNSVVIMLKDLYDVAKLKIWHAYFPKVLYKSTFVFVSKYIMDSFFEWTKISPDLLREKSFIIHNGIGKAFEIASYDFERKKEYDFITIRHTLDWSHCCLDIINNLAKANPDLTFHVVGKGKFFDFNQKANNLSWEDRLLSHSEIIEQLQNARCSLMLTRQDTQGLMMCEMASIGMPVITSDIPVCHEVFDEFENVAMIPNDDFSVDLDGICKRLEEKQPYKKNEKYFNKNTSQKEIELFKHIYNKTENKLLGEINT